MTRKNRNLVLSAAALAALVILAVATRWPGRDQDQPIQADGGEAESARPEQVSLVNRPPEDLRRVGIENARGEIKLTRTDGEGWSVDGLPPGFRLKEGLPESLADDLARIDGTLIEESPEDWAVYGLEAPAARIAAKDADGSEVQIEFGADNPTGTGRYARKAGENSVYLVRNRKARRADWTISDLRDDRLPEFTADQVAGLLIRSGPRRFQAVPTPGDRSPYRTIASAMTVIAPWSSPAPAEDYAVQNLLADSPPPSRIGRFLDTRPADPAELGLGPNADRIRLDLADGRVYDLEIGDIESEGFRFARELSDPDLPFLVSEDDLGMLDARPFELTSKFVFLANIDTVESLEIRGAGELHELTREAAGDPEDDADDVYRISGVQVPEQDFKDVYQGVIGLLYEGAAERRPAVAEADVAVRFSHVDPGIDDALIEFFPYDEVYYAVAVNGAAGDFIIGRYQVRDMLESLRR